MTAKHILHILSPLPQVSPFDVNLSLDAGFDAVVPYSDVTPDDVTGLVRDAIFSRPPKDGVRTGVFFGGKSAALALDMMEAAQQAMVPPFVVSLFADPAGSFTTAAALVGCVEKVLQRSCRRELTTLHIVVFGATGVVGFASSVVAALQGAKVVLAGHDGLARVRHIAGEIDRRFGVSVEAADARDDPRKSALLHDAEAVFCCGPPGVSILNAALLRSAPKLLAIADVNAVPPPGVEGLDPKSMGDPLPGLAALGVGALAIGEIKYRTEFDLFRRMIEADKPVKFDFREAFTLARGLLSRI
jgi:methylene-tetrahydromethanopterin dehydrogenase